MKILLPIFLYIFILLAMLQNWLIILGVSVLFFSFRYGAIWLIPAAIFLDGYFGHFYSVPYMSLSAIFWYWMVEYLRPKLAAIRHEV